VAAVLAAPLAVTGAGSATAASAKAATRPHPAVRYLQKTAMDLLRAQRLGTIASFDRVLARHADVPSIAMYSLGRYKPSLPRSKQAVKTAIDERPMKDGDDWLVRSKVWLASGASRSAVAAGASPM